VEKAKQLRELLGNPRPIQAVGAHNGLTAVLAEEAGFDALWVSSFELSASRALPDTSLLTMTDYLNAAVQVDRAASLPVIADCDTGFGNALNVAHTVKEFEAAGIAAVCIEDKLFPKVNSFSEHAQPLVDLDEFAHRIAVGKEVQSHPDFVVIARTEAFIAGYDTAEALRRANAYSDAGADAVLIHSKESSPWQIEEFLAGWDGRAPVVVVPTTYNDWHIDDIGRAGISMCIYANHGVRATVSSVRQAFTAIREYGATAKIEPAIASVREIFTIQNHDEWLSLE
jgi:phosphoenolpyruvate phosphomutase